MEGKGLQQTTLANHQGSYRAASLEGENCRMTAGKKPDELRHCHAAGVTAGMEGLLERRHPAERACLRILNRCTACRPQPLFIADERYMKLMMVV